MTADSTAVAVTASPGFNYVRSIVQLVLALVAMGGASYLVLRWLRNRGRLPGARNSEKIEIVSQRRISPRAVLHLVHWNGRTLLIGSTDQSITVLDRLEDQEESDV